MKQQTQVFENKLDRDLEVFVEMNLDRYVLRPGDVMRVTYDHKGGDYGLHTVIEEQVITIFLQDWDTAVVTINGIFAKPWS